ncbi:MAG: EthD domain-containing protein [Bdellovibrionota bacterium]
MFSNGKVPRATRRGIMIGLTGLASGSALKIGWAAEPGPFVIKRASLLQRKPGISHQEFVKHWVEIHAPMARACPGIGRYALTIIKSASTRKDVAPYEIQVDGIAELWFKSQADFDAYSSSPATKRLRDDGATFIGREIDFVTEEKVIIS